MAGGLAAAAAAPKQRSCGPTKSIRRARLAPAARSASSVTPSMCSCAHCARSLRAMCALRRQRRFHDGVAVLAGAQRQAAEETLEYRRQLRLDVGQLEELLVQQVFAALAVPLQAVEFARPAATLDH